MKQETSSPNPATTPPQTSSQQLGEDTQYCRRVLLNLVEIGNEIAETLAEEIRAHRYNPAPGPSPVPAAAAAYATVAQSIRRTIMLHDKLGQPSKTAPNRTAARKRIIRDVEDAIESNAPEDKQESLHAEFLERLDRPELEEEIATRALPDIVTDICRDLDIVGIPGIQSWKRRSPHDIAILNARAEQLPGAPPSPELLALLAAMPPKPPPGPPLERIEDMDMKTLMRNVGLLRES